LVRRIIEDMGLPAVDVARPWRVPRYKVVRPNELERAVQQCLRRTGAGAVLVILDADDDCPATLGPQLLSRCSDATEVPTAVVLAMRELECWFLGAKESLRGTRGIRGDAVSLADAEQVRGAKERLTENMSGHTYIAMDDQPALAARMDIEQARRNCPSFGKLMRDVCALLSGMAST